MKTRILFCRCLGADTIPGDVRERVGQLLDGSAADVTIVDDLCSLVAARDGRLAELVAEGELIVMACHPRGVRSLFKAAGVDLDPARSRIIDLRRVDWAAAEEAVPAATEGPPAAPESVPGGNAWFPVIDRDRCSKCRQCVDFCLFGVYSLDDDGRPQVEHPLNCKDNCPACARVCPEVAIIFPKVGEVPLDGDEIEDEALEQARVKVDVETFLGDDVYTALKERRRKARARLLRKREDREKALEERKRFVEADDATAGEDTP